MADAEKSTEATAQSPPPKSPVSPKSPADAEQAESSPPIDAGILPASHWEPVQEEVIYDGDSGLGDLASSTASLSSSILQYRTVLGRTYASEIGKSEGWTPNDEKHTESMDIHHHACTLLLDGKLFLAPIKGETISKVVDIGTGTGIWAIDFGDEFPNAEVIGTDISPIQPTWIPPNVKFEIDDANLPWTWRDDTFDFVHVRGMIGTIIDWPAFYREAFRCCKPGGWMEHHDEAAEWHAANGEISEDSAMGQWGKVFSEGGKKFGRTFRLIQDDVQIKGMQEAGFVDIVVKDYMCPIGDWPRDPKQKEIGIFAKLVLETDLAGAFRTNQLKALSTSSGPLCTWQTSGMRCGTRPSTQPIPIAWYMGGNRSSARRERIQVDR
ncbi:S-adenosyl-L-methionine-dependent methyltransferase [Chaetomium tenue]|uniref:S-adenosyl-L-methionine-dependent methyltransferase n=1 Tax=Chaetomium tenue TaxID=1854479 RepID=A0ACB7PAZ4_9PEZI|nr:S-adenosyl-L-methionine-dependent methyltransferase [Chaetomium globosum]